MSADRIPQATWEGTILGLRVAVLDDGSRVVNADDLSTFFERFVDYEINREDLRDEMTELKAFLDGGPTPLASTERGE